MNPRAVLIPGGTRLRAVHAVDRNGCCEVLYDQERNRLVEVPDLFHYHIAMALERMDLDEDLMSWLAAEDLLTYDESSGWAGPPRASFSELADFFEARGDGFGCAYFVDDQSHCRIRRDREGETAQILNCMLGEASAASRVTLHLGSEGVGVDLPWLRRLVARTGELAARSGKQVSYELWMAVEKVTPSWAEFLAQHPFRVRVHCDGPGSAGIWFSKHAEQGVVLLQRHLGERLAVHSLLAGDRLADLWAWARKMDLSHLHATPLDVYRDDVAARDRALRQFREDLSTVCEDMLLTLKDGEGGSLLYEPVIRTARRLARGFPDSTPRSTPCLGMIFEGRVLPVWGTGRVPVTPGASVSNLEGTKRHTCDRCWARSLCGRGVCADPALGSAERVGATDRHCGFWRAEVDAGVLFFRRLSQEDPDYLLGLKESAHAETFDSLDLGDRLVELMTC